MSANKIIAELDAEQMTKDVPAFAPETLLLFR